jgi:hypothetical protein
VRPESRALGFFSLLRPARIRIRESGSETVGDGFQVLLFHESEIMPLDIGNRPKVEKIGEKSPFL